MLTRTEIVGIGLYGTTYFVFVVLAVIGYYMWQMDSIRSGQRSLYSVMGIGLVFHIAVASIAYMMLTIIAIYYRSTTSKYDPKEMAGMLFAIDWQHVNMQNITNTYGVAAANAIMFIKSLMMAFNFTLLIGISLFVIGIFAYAAGNAFKQAENGSVSSAIIGALAKQGVLIFVVILHFAIANAFLVGLYDDVKGGIGGAYGGELKPMPVDIRGRFVRTLTGG